MQTNRAARRLALAAAYGGGSVGLLGGALWGVMKTEAGLARRTIGDANGKPPSGDGVYGRELAGDVLGFAMLGDSAAAGYGVSNGLDTPAALIGDALSGLCGRPVRAVCHAFVGAQTSDLDGQIDRALTCRPDVAAIVVGTNDVTHSVLPSESVRRLGEAVRRLREAGCEVVVGTCPDLGTIKPIRQPLRSFARMWSRHLAARQAVEVVESGGRSVSLGSLLGRDFEQAPQVFFSDDKFHPSETGYASMVAVMFPAIARASGHEIPDDDAVAHTPSQVLSVGSAARQAAQHSGTEMSRVPSGTKRWHSGRSAVIRRIRR